MSIQSLARASYLGIALYALSLALLCYLEPTMLAAATAVVGLIALAAILSQRWKTGLLVLISIMLVTFLAAMGLLALGSFALLPVSVLQVLAVACLDNRATADCAIDIQLARLRP